MYCRLSFIAAYFLLGLFTIILGHHIWIKALKAIRNINAMIVLRNFAWLPLTETRQLECEAAEYERKIQVIVCKIQKQQGIGKE